MAKSLIGQFPNLRPDSPAVFAESVAAVLAGYPQQMLADAINPKIGLASKTEWLTLKALSDYCAERLEFYTAMAQYRPPPAPRLEPPSSEAMAARVAELFRQLADDLRASTARAPLDTLIEQRAAARRLRREEVLRRAEEPAK